MINILFYFFAFFVIASALFSAFAKNVVHAVFSFFITLFSLAGLYVLAYADLIAVVQVMVYVGGVVVLILFGLMLSSKEVLSLLKRENEFKKNKRMWAFLPASIVCILFFSLLWQSMSYFSDNLPWMLENASQTQATNNVAAIGVQLMSTHLLPFEVISLLLLLALMGAAYLARSEVKS